jgi:hypothetical protein
MPSAMTRPIVSVGRLKHEPGVEVQWLTKVEAGAEVCIHC